MSPRKTDRELAEHEHRRQGTEIAHLRKDVDDHEDRIVVLEETKAAPVLERPATPRSEFRPPAPLAPRPMTDRDLDAEMTRLREDLGHENASQLGAFMRWQSEQSRRDRERDAALVLVARELGVEAKLPDGLRASLPPPSATTKAPAAIPEVRRRTRATHTASLVTIALLVLEALPGLLRALEHAANAINHACGVQP